MRGRVWSPGKMLRAVEHPGLLQPSRIVAVGCDIQVCSDSALVASEDLSFPTGVGRVISI